MPEKPLRLRHARRCHRRGLSPLSDDYPRGEVARPLAGGRSFPGGMVQNEVGTEAFRQARPLAKGQKSADVKHDWGIATPPPPTKTVGGRDRIYREKRILSGFR